VKITLTRGVTISGGTYSKNFGDGIWFDASVYDMKVIGADVQDNLGHGIEIEISAKFVVADNLVTGNGKVGILPRNSNDGRIWNNTLVGNMGNINVLQDSRTPANTSYGKDSRQPYPDPTMTWVISNIEIKNNVNASPAPTSNGALAMREETGKGANVMGGVIDGNFYNRVSATAPKNQFGWAVAGGSPLAFANLAAYRSATGMDPNGYTIDGSNALDANFNLTPSAAAAAAGVARGLPADIATLIAQPAGTAHLGVFGAAVPHANPVASFTASAAGLVGSFGGAASSASDGAKVASYSWDFGDGSAAGSGASATHQFAKAGSYPVKLTVTDSLGATNSVSKPIAISAPLLASDGFLRSVSNGWGTADQGGAWAVTGNAANFSVAGGYAKMNLATAGATTTASLSSTVQADTDTHATFALDKAPTSAVYFTTVARKSGTNFYGAKLVVSSAGTVTAYLTRSVSGAETTFASGAIAGMKFAANTPVRLRFQVSGTGTANLKFKAWNANQTEPTTWAVSAADTTAVLQKAGANAFTGYLSGTATAPVAISVNGLAIHAP
jgi:parallel beta-helix repeat protein